MGTKIYVCLYFFKNFSGFSCVYRVRGRCVYRFPVVAFVYIVFVVHGRACCVVRHRSDCKDGRGPARTVYIYVVIDSVFVRVVVTLLTLVFPVAHVCLLCALHVS